MKFIASLLAYLAAWAVSCVELIIVQLALILTGMSIRESFTPSTMWANASALLLIYLIAFIIDLPVVGQFEFGTRPGRQKSTY